MRESSTVSLEALTAAWVGRLRHSCLLAYDSLPVLPHRPSSLGALTLPNLLRSVCRYSASVHDGQGDSDGRRLICSQDGDHADGRAG
jgi:hypothetical protein